MINQENIDLSVVLPCRNEEKSLADCIRQIKEIFAQNNINGEIIVSDSSVDQSAEIARSLNVRLVKHDQFGYGRACLEGLKAARGQYLFLADADLTYDFKEIPRFLSYLKQGFDLVLGNRFGGQMEKGAMPHLNKYLGNPVLSWLFRVFFRAKITDVHCGMRAITKDALSRLNLQTTGMEFASEMVIKAVKKKLKIKELPINYYCRKGESKLKPLADGWRHLRFMLLYSPLFLFFLPGAFLFLGGLVLLFLLYFDLVTIFGLKLFYHPIFFSILMIIFGYQLIIFSVFAKTYAITHLGEESVLMNKLHRHITIEKASLIGLLGVLLGLIIYGAIFSKWLQSGFGPLNEVKNSLLALTIIIIGVQTIFSSFILSILGIKEK